MTKREIMERAHELARTMKGDYSARLVVALRQAWMEARLLEVGSLWEKHGYRRIYFNDLAAWYGLEYNTYNTGNISNAWVDGERVSNSEGRRILGRLAGAKVWYDLTDGKFHGKVNRQEDFERIVERIKEGAKVGVKREQGRRESAA